MMENAANAVFFFSFLQSQRAKCSKTSCLLTVCGAAICMRNGLRPIRGDVFLTSLMQRPSVSFSAAHISSEPHCVVTSHYTLGYNVLNQILTFVCFSFITYNEQI